ncbi:MAG: GatB/YqeY domain-containing protein [Planktomarina sp.]
MSLRDRLATSTKEAMKAREASRLATLRLINAAIKDRDIDARAEGMEDGVSDDNLLAILGKMVKQRQESARAYEEGNRLELAEKELSEIVIIEEFLPRQLDQAETEKAIAEAITEVDATTLRDMGKVMGILKSKYTGQLDFGKVGGLVKAQLG